METALVSKALVKASAEIGNVPFDAQNPHFKNRYASLGAVLSVIKPILAKHDLAIVQLTECLTNGGVQLDTIILHSSGESISMTYPVVPVKADPQGMGSALTYARRYCAMAICGCAGEDDDAHVASQPMKPLPPAIPAIPAIPTKAPTPTRTHWKPPVTSPPPKAVKPPEPDTDFSYGYNEEGK